MNGEDLTGPGQAGSSSKRYGGTPSKCPWEQPSHFLQSLFVFHWTVLQSKELENNGFAIAQRPFVDLGLALPLSTALLTEHLTSCSLKLVVKEVSGQLNGTRASNWPHEKHRGRVVSPACQLWRSQMPLLFRNSSKKKEQNQTFSI